MISAREVRMHPESLIAPLVRESRRAFRRDSSTRESAMGDLDIQSVMNMMEDDFNEAVDRVAGHCKHQLAAADSMRLWALHLRVTSGRPAGCSAGCVVTLAGLVSKPELNGRSGTIAQGEPENGRLGVRVEGLDKPIALKPQNLQPKADAQPAGMSAEQWQAWLETAAMSTGAAMLEYIQTAHRIEEAANAPRDIPAVEASAPAPPPAGEAPASE